MKIITESVHFPNLDGLRSIACLIVLFSHSLEPTNIGLSQTSGLNFFTTGGNGVQIFFCLSGFLITFLLLQEEQIKGKIHVGKFYMRRVLRIWPMYFFTVIVGLVLYPALKTWFNQEVNWAYDKPMHFLFLSNFDVYRVERYFQGMDAGIVDITWSVSIEEQFYLVWPLLFVFLPNKMARLGVFIALAGFSILFQVYFVTNPTINYYSTWSCALNLICGGLLAVVLFTSIQRKKTVKIPPAFNIAFYLAFLLAISFATSGSNYLFNRWLLIIFVLYVILEQTVNQRRLFDLSAIPFLNKISKYTYSIYLIHPLIQLAILQTARILKFEPTVPIELIKVILTILLSILCSVMTYNIIEKTFLKLKSNFA